MGLVRMTDRLDDGEIAFWRAKAEAVQGAETRRLAHNSARKAALDRSLQRATVSNRLDEQI